MKTIRDFVNNLTVNESSTPNNLVSVKTGDKLFAIADATTKVVTLTIKEVTKSNIPWNDNVEEIVVEFTPNDLKVNNYILRVYKNENENIQLTITYADVATLVYVAVNKELLKEELDKTNTKKLEDTLEEIKSYENKIAELYKRKQQLEKRLSTELTESLKK